MYTFHVRNYSFFHFNDSFTVKTHNHFTKALLQSCAGFIKLPAPDNSVEKLELLFVSN